MTTTKSVRRAARFTPPWGLVGLFYIKRYQYLTASQFAAVTGKHKETARKELSRFESRQIVGSFGGTGLDRTGGRMPKFYYLTRKGLEFLREESGIPDELLGPFKQTKTDAKGGQQMRHRMATVDALLSLEKGVRERERLNILGAFLEYRRVSIKGRTFAETSDFVADEEAPENRIIPDAAVVIENVETGDRGLFFLEIDMGTETVVSQISNSPRLTLAHKLGQYDRYLASGRFAEKYAPWGRFDYFTVLFITTSPRRIENIRNAAEKLNPDFHDFYFFNTIEETNTEFFNSLWRGRSPNDKEHHALLEA